MSEKNRTKRRLLYLLTVLVIGGALPLTIGAILPERMLASGTAVKREPSGPAKARGDPKAELKRKQQPEQASKPPTKSLSIAAKGITMQFPEGWSAAQPTLNSWVILNVPADQQDTATPSVRVLIGYLDRPDHADAVRQLAEYANESRKATTFLTVGGWPALQRVQLVKRPQPSQGPMFADRNMVQITTAVAAGNLLVRLEAALPSDADQQLKDAVLAIGQSLTFESSGDPAQVEQVLRKLQNWPKRTESPKGGGAWEERAKTKTLNSGEVAGAAAPIFPTVPLNNLGTNGELEIAVSSNGTNIVIAKQSGFVTSNDGGQTFPFSGGLPVSDGDGSLAFAQSGNFYMSALACFAGSCSAPCPASSNCVQIAPSTNNGQSFGALTNAVVCPNSGGTACSSDQEHISADRVNAGAGGADRVYMAFRDLSGSANVTCSPDSGATWAPRLALEAGSDFPRVTTGGDGFVYVVYALNNHTIRVDKFNACTTSAAQMTRAAGGFPMTVSAFNTFAGCEVANGFGGLNRCNDGNLLSGPSVSE